MKVAVTSGALQVSGRLGPICIACGNTRSFWIHTPQGERLWHTADLPRGDVRVNSCGKCRSRNSIILGRVD